MPWHFLYLPSLDMWLLRAWQIHLKILISILKMTMKKKLFNSDLVEHNSRPPLRWIANLFGRVSGWAILHVAYLDEENNFGLKHKIYSFIYQITWPLYYKFGTFYRFDFEMEGDGWDDYDSDGIPYWEKWDEPLMMEDQWDDYDWDYEDSNGDAFRVIRK